MKVIEKILHILLSIVKIIVYVLVILIIYNFIQLKICNKNYADFFGYTFLEISSGSMEDTLHIYDVVLVKITDDIAEDDIITYKSGDSLITHRVIKIEENGIVTKGDANNTEDELIAKEDVIGKVISVYSRLGIWFKVFVDPKVLISILITLILIAKIISKDK